MADKLTYAGASLAISAAGTTDPDDKTPQAVPADLDAVAYAALNWTDVGSCGSVGDWLTTDNIINYDTVDDNVTNKQKGVKDAGSPDVECAYIPDDAGQIAMLAASKLTSNFGFRLTLSNGDILYSRGVVGGGGIGGGGGREDFVTRQFSLGLNQEPVEA